MVSDSRHRAAFPHERRPILRHSELGWKLSGDGDLIEDCRPFFSSSSGLRVLVERVSGNQRKRESGFRVNHLLVGKVDFAPAAGFFQGGS